MSVARLPVLAIVAVILLSCGVAVAGPNQPSASYFMPGCRDAASLITFSVQESEEEVARMNFCAGIVVGLSFMGELHGICAPPDTTSDQTTSIVVQYIDGQPARTDEDFRSFAIEALRATGHVLQTIQAVINPSPGKVPPRRLPRAARFARI